MNKSTSIRFISRALLALTLFSTNTARSAPTQIGPGRAPRRVKTLVIGGGMCGSACAITLNRHARSTGRAELANYVLVTDELGGRIKSRQSTLGTINMGASLVTSKYAEVGKRVGRGKRFRPLTQVYFQDGKAFRNLLHPITLWNLLRPSYLVPLLKLAKRIVAFNKEYRRFIEAAKTEDPAALTASGRYPLVSAYTAMSADHLINKLDLGPLHYQLFRHSFHGTYLTDTSNMNALHYLAALSLFGTKFWEADFSQTVRQLRTEITAPSADNLIEGHRVTDLAQRQDGRYHATLDDGRRVEAENVVVAMPSQQARSFMSKTLAAKLPSPPQIKRVESYVGQVRGVRRKALRKKRLVTIDPERSTETGVVGISRVADGSDIVYATRDGASLADYYEDGFEVVGAWQRWQPAFEYPRTLRPVKLGHGLFVFSDNLIGLENAFTYGQLIANTIAAQTR